MSAHWLKFLPNVTARDINKFAMPIEDLDCEITVLSELLNRARVKRNRLDADAASVVKMNGWSKADIADARAKEALAAVEEIKSGGNSNAKALKKLASGVFVWTSK